MAKAEQRNPFAPAPLQGFQRYYGLLRPCRCASVLSPSRLTPLVASPVMPAFEVAGMDAVQVLTFRSKAWSRFAPPTRRMPLGPYQGIARARPAGRVTPRFRHRLISFRRFCSGSLALAFLDLACRDHCPDVSATLTTTAFDRSSLRWLGIGS
jgi:hypothetical protein